MTVPLVRLLVFCTVLGILSMAVGGYQCLKGYNYSVAAQHETTTVGRIVGVSRHGTMRYEFNVDGVKVDDTSDVCTTPLAPDACRSNGSVLVYYSQQPFPNSLLEDFAIASSRAYRIGKPALAIGLPLGVLTGAALAILPRKNKTEDESDPQDEDDSDNDEHTDVIHVVPVE